MTEQEPQTTVKFPAAFEERRVHFANKCRQRAYIHAGDYTEEEMISSYYSREELKEFKAECRQIIIAYRKGVSRGEEKRGLELKIPTGEESSNSIRKQARYAVLLEQELQFQENDINEELLASVYQSFSNTCRVNSYIMGLSDELFVQRLRETPHKLLARSLESPIYLKKFLPGSPLPAVFRNNNARLQDQKPRKVAPSAA